jgi:hypothetical protein
MFASRLSVVLPALVVAAACGPIGATGGTGGGAPASSASSSGVSAGASSGAGSGATSGSPADSDGGSEAAGAGTDALAPGGYSVTGKTIYDAAHKPHLFHGVDRPSLEWSPTGDQLSEADYQLMGVMGWKANVVRIALNQDFWLSDSPSYAGAYAMLIDQQIAWAEGAGLDVILDLHWSDKGQYGQKPAQQRMADAHSVAFWADVAARYQGDGRVLFELYNEPHDVPWDVWLKGGASGDGFTVAGMQQLYDTVRSTGAENLVIIGGLQFAYDLSGVATHRVQGHNIVWATHPYNQTGKQSSNWDAAFGALSATDPVMATEFGDSTGCGTSYDSELIAYADAHKISWTAWAWYVASCKFPSIIADWSGTPTAAGQVEKAALLGY